MYVCVHIYTWVIHYHTLLIKNICMHAYIYIHTRSLHPHEGWRGQGIEDGNDTYIHTYVHTYTHTYTHGLSSTTRMARSRYCGWRIYIHTCMHAYPHTHIPTVSHWHHGEIKVLRLELGKSTQAGQDALNHYLSR